MRPTAPLTHDIVLIGGGHTHALVLRMLAMDPIPGARLTLIDPAPQTAYTGMLPGHIAGHYPRDAIMIDLQRLCDVAGARLIIGAANAIDRTARTVTVPGRPPIGYDILSLDIGVTSHLPDLPGFADHAVAVKPFGPFTDRWTSHLSDPGPVAVIGGGIAGVELTLAMTHALAGRAPVTLVERDRLLATARPATRRRLLRALTAAGVTIVEGATPARVTPDALHLTDGRAIPTTLTVSTAGARAHAWLADTGLAQHQGFIAVNRHLQSSDPSIFASGDCAHLTDDPRPKAGVFAVRQAPILAANLHATVNGAPLKRFRPQRDYLKLISLGGQTALADKWGLTLAAPALWRVKDRIDRAFMTRLSDLPRMATPDNADGPPCAGCGAKVARSALTDALSALPATDRPDITPLPGDDAALLTTGTVRQVITTDHLSAVTTDPVLMTQIACIHALGDIWAMGATPQAATLSLILPRQSDALTRRTLSEILSTAHATLTAHGAAIVGGHTTHGAEMTIGLTITGLLDRPPITIAGGCPGDALILTKPLGSGTILAAQMRGLASGPVIAACHQTMIQPQSDAARILSGAHAMTDVTGFGLAGHLANICQASGCAADLTLPAIPLMDGAEPLAQTGLRSTLWQANREGAGPVLGAAGAKGVLLFDPQTCGGLLAAVAPDQAESLLSDLRQAGYPAAIIGHLTAGAPAITCR